MEINLLDMGNSQFGDCLIITHGKKRILIDGAHSGDAESIIKQIGKVLGEAPPYIFDLLIVTHCHSDHIGCLPILVKENALKIKVALVADEKLGFARSNDGDGALDAVFSSDQKGLLTALMEEDHSNLLRAALGEFIADAVSLENNYKFMLKQLSMAGTQVIRFKGLEKTNGIEAIEEAFSDMGLKILGPTSEHILLCAAALGLEADSNAVAIAKNISDDAAISKLADEYLNIIKKASDAVSGEDAAGEPGAAKNNQSIVIKLEADGWKALLAGDMQFARADISNLGAIMQQLLDDVNAAGPYDFIKLTHHTAANGLNEAILSNWLLNTSLFAHTGGLSDPKHPSPAALKILKAHEADLKLARTDRNGIITIRKIGAVPNMEISKGDFNDFTTNVRIDSITEMETPPPVVAPKQIPAAAPPQFNIQTVVEKDSFVEVTAKIPHTSTRVTITVDVDPEKKKLTGGTDGGMPPVVKVLPLPERFKNLLFVTNTSLLAQNIGVDACNKLMEVIAGTAGIGFIDIPPGIYLAVVAANIVRSKITAGIKGIVLIGGYDVLPALQLDVLDADTRSKLERAGKTGNDADDFMVWSDDIYGDLDGDTLPELPVSRIPDGKSAALVIKSFNASTFQSGNRFGIRNIARPFANKIYDIVPGTKNAMEISAKFSPVDIRSESISGAVYLMLHGSSNDGTKFWGETSTQNAYEAMNINNVPTSAPGTIIFTGCCWGALIVDSLAYNTNVVRAGLKSRTPQSSIALTFLQNGALAFVGCTGSHYSPLTEPYDFYGRPLHDDFWQGIGNKMSPSEALLYAKKRYLKDMPHGRKDLVSRALEMKILREFTCLGIGW